MLTLLLWLLSVAGERATGQHLSRIPPAQVIVTNPGERGLIPAQPFWPPNTTSQPAKSAPSAGAPRRPLRHSNAHLNDVKSGIFIQDHGYRRSPTGTSRPLPPVVLTALRQLKARHQLPHDDLATVEEIQPTDVNNALQVTRSTTPVPERPVASTQGTSTLAPSFPTSPRKSPRPRPPSPSLASLSASTSTRHGRPRFEVSAPLEAPAHDTHSPDSSTLSSVLEHSPPHIQLPIGKLHGASKPPTNVVDPLQILDEKVPRLEAPIAQQARSTTPQSTPENLGGDSPSRGQPLAALHQFHSPRPSLAPPTVGSASHALTPPAAGPLHATPHHRLQSVPAQLTTRAPVSRLFTHLEQTLTPPTHAPVIPPTLQHAHHQERGGTLHSAVTSTPHPHHAHPLATHQGSPAPHPSSAPGSQIGAPSRDHQPHRPHPVGAPPTVLDTRKEGHAQLDTDPRVTTQHNATSSEQYDNDYYYYYYDDEYYDDYGEFNYDKVAGPTLPSAGTGRPSSRPAPTTPPPPTPPVLSLTPPTPQQPERPIAVPPSNSPSPPSFKSIPGRPQATQPPTRELIPPRLSSFPLDLAKDRRPPSRPPIQLSTTLTPPHPNQFTTEQPHSMQQLTFLDNLPHAPSTFIPPEITTKPSSEQVTSSESQFPSPASVSSPTAPPHQDSTPPPTTHTSPPSTTPSPVSESSAERGDDTGAPPIGYSPATLSRLPGPLVELGTLLGNGRYLTLRAPPEDLFRYYLITEATKSSKPRQPVYFPPEVTEDHSMEQRKRHTEGDAAAPPTQRDIRKVSSEPVQAVSLNTKNTKSKPRNSFSRLPLLGLTGREALTPTLVNEKPDTLPTPAGISSPAPRPQPRRTRLPKESEPVNRERAER